MKALFYLLVFILICGFAFGAWMLFGSTFKKQASDIRDAYTDYFSSDRLGVGGTNIDPGQTGPTASSTLFMAHPTIPDKTVVIQLGTNQEVAKAFLTQVESTEGVEIGNTYIATPKDDGVYALQMWELTGTGGGLTLFKQNASGEWELFLTSGGAPSVSSLVTVGVPQQIAEELMAKLEQSVR